ncbi:MAG TPA: lysophospholipid acyltransferase family protein [Terriglobales bacterium]|nr:lysophospholipid acyltransferase family protein [Terriglobales bacterium]
MASLRDAVRYNGLFWRKFAYLGCVYGPEWWKTYSPGPIGAIVYTLIAPNRRAAIQNMQRVLGVHDARLVRRAAIGMFAQFARCFAESMEYYGPRPHPIRFDVPEVDPLGEALERGRGAVVVTGHFGNWDVAAKGLHSYGRPMNLVMAHEQNQSTHEFVRVAREQVGVRVIYSDSSVFSSLNMIRALRSNEIVAIQLDRAESAGGTRLVPFFGAPATFPSGPFVLARLAGAPVIPVFVPRLGRRHYAVRIGEQIEVPKDGKGQATIDRAMLQAVQAFEATVREFPTQWFRFTPFWPEDAVASEPQPSERDLRRAAMRARS